MVITAITPQRHDQARCNIEVDGRFYCGLSLETVVKNRLKVGTAVSAERLAEIQLESERQAAYDKALRHISVSMKTERDTRTFLKGKGYLDEVIDDVVERMKRYGFLDDAAYARSYAESAGKRKGKRLIAQELKGKGVGEAEIAEALASLENEEESARSVLEKYLRGKERDPKTVRKAYAYLIGKGYSHDVARTVLGDLSEE